MSDIQIEEKVEEKQNIPSHHQIPKLGIVLSLVFILVMLTVGIYYLSTRISIRRESLEKPNEDIRQETSVPSIDKSSANKELKQTQWVNCDDVRDVIEENNRLYVACNGGVLVVDKTSGKVVDQISMTQGLSNHTTTSLAKKGNILYIGTQDGFTIFDLSSRQAKKISVSKGLVNGANIFLALDGDILWIGTFDGLSRYDTISGQITNYKEELADNSTKYSVNKVLVTSKAIYISVLANSYSSGSIARYDKINNKWERFGPKDFLDKIDQYSRVDFFSLKNANDRIYVSDDREVWESEDKEGAKWKKRENIATQLKKTQNDFIKVWGGYKDNLFLSSEDRLYTYSPLSEELTQIPLDNSDNNNIFKSSQVISLRENKLWFYSPFNSSDPWLSWIDLDDDKMGKVSLTGRAKGFSKVIALIDDKPLIFGSGAIWRYEKESDEFKSLFTFSAESGIPDQELIFQPLADTSKILSFYQSCGMGCSKPQMFLYDYKNNSVKTVELPAKLTKALAGEGGEEWSYQGLLFDGFNKDTGEFRFGFYNQEKQEKTEDVIFKATDETWRFEEGGKKEKKEEIALCNPYYTFEKNGSKFSLPDCSKPNESDKYRFSYDENLWQEDKNTQEKVKLDFPSSQAPYSPFENFYGKVGVTKIVLAFDKLYLVTNRGLPVYNLSEQKWRLIEVKDGLVSSEVTSLAVGQGIVWVTTNWGGLSGIID